jgi:hypothetical protein
MKPFNLERALSGDPLITRGGIFVYELKLFNKPSDFKLAGVLHGYIETWKIDGRYDDYVGNTHDNDLLMAEKPKKKYYLMLDTRNYPNSPERWLNTSGAYESKEDLLKNYDEENWEMIEIEIEI